MTTDTLKVGDMVRTVGFQPPAVGIPGVLGEIIAEWGPSEVGFEWVVDFGARGGVLAMRSDEIRKVS